MISSTRVFALLFAVIVPLFVGCVGPSPVSSVSTTTLTSAQIQQVYASAHTAVYAALKESGDSNILPSTGTAPTTDATGSYTYNCPSGGTVTLAWTYTNSGTNLVRNTTVVPNSCSDGTLILNGDPSIKLIESNSINSGSDTANLYTNNTASTISYAPVKSNAFPSGNCSVSMNLVATKNETTGAIGTCSSAWSVCGQSVTESCSIPFPTTE